MLSRSRPAVLVAALLFGSTVPAQLAISEVLVDPVGTNAGKQIVEVTNITNSSFTPTGWWICAPLTYASIPKVAIPAGGVVKFHLGASGTSTKSDFYFPFFRALGTADVFLLFKSNFFLNNSDIIDFVSWGGGTLRIGQAVAVKLWESSTASVTLPKGEGKTIQWNGQAHASTAWVSDAPASLGKPNQIGVASTFGAGCGGNATTPKMAIAAGSRPKLGGTFTIGIPSLPTSKPGTTTLIIGVSKSSWGTNKLPMDLGPLGMPKCSLLVSFDLLVPLPNPSGTVIVPFRIPNTVSLLGARFFLQAYAAEAKANALGAVITNAIDGRAGN